MKAIVFERAETYEPEPDWKRVSLCAEDGVSVEWFRKPPRHASPMHDHPQAQVTIVLEGRMRVWTEEGQEAVLGPGDAAWVPGGERHAIENALETVSVGIDVFAPGRSFDFWAKRLGGR
jgi:quercetin dioxygenase-like cupin family protein